MTLENSTTGTCRDHSGFAARIAALEKADDEQWREINQMKTRSLATLTSVVLTLLASLLSLAILLARVAG